MAPLPNPIFLKVDGTPKKQWSRDMREVVVRISCGEVSGASFTAKKCILNSLKLILTLLASCKQHVFKCANFCDVDKSQATHLEIQWSQNQSPSPPHGAETRHPTLGQSPEHRFELWECRCSTWCGHPERCKKHSASHITNRMSVCECASLCLQMISISF